MQKKLKICKPIKKLWRINIFLFFLIMQFTIYVRRKIYHHFSNKFSLFLKKMISYRTSILIYIFV